MYKPLVKTHYDFDDLCELVAALRAPDGCPWDRAATHESLRANAVEEAYEVCEAIDQQSDTGLAEELGDLLLQVLLHAEIAREGGRFDIEAVIAGLYNKLVSRHDHVFGDSRAASAAEALTAWDAQKRVEKGQATHASAVEDVPKSLPALMRAQKVQHRAAKMGFCYPDVAGAMSDLRSEVREVEEALGENDPAHLEEEVGDLIFSAVNVARKIGLNAEQCLTNATNKFINRFKRVEDLALSRGLMPDKLSAQELDELYREIKFPKDEVR